jgi:hypothetical protein
MATFFLLCQAVEAVTAPFISAGFLLYLTFNKLFMLQIR